MITIHVLEEKKVPPNKKLSTFREHCILQFNFSIRNIVSAYGKNEMEDLDVFPMVKTLIGEERHLTKFAIDLIAEKFPSLASFVSERFGFGPVPFEEEFVPRCKEPFNKELHDLPISGEVVVKDKTHIVNFAVHLKRSNYFAMDFQILLKPSEEGRFVTAVSFCLRSKVYIVMPTLFPETIEPVAKALKENPKMVFVYEWPNRKQTCLETFKWCPEQVVDVLDVARENGVTPSVDAMTERTVGGSFCRRASKFPSTVIPSAPALNHRAIRVTLFYEFAVKEKKLRDSSGRSKVTRYDREAEEVRHRLDRSHKGNAGHSRDRHRDGDRGRRN